MPVQHTEETLIAEAVQAALRGCDAILEVYRGEFDVELKADDSPLTLADRRSHDIITGILGERFPDVPVLSEEGAHAPYETRGGWRSLWVVDPLDGTREFVKRNGEFTVNIALVRGNRPVGGVIAVPVREEVFVAAGGRAARFTRGQIETEEWDLSGSLDGAACLPSSQTERSRGLRVVASRSHLDEETSAFIERLRSHYGSVELVAAGSARKLCLIAEGVADVYPRFAPTMEWDTAAGQALVEAAGGTLVTTTDRKPMRYNRRDLVNSGFVAVAPGRDASTIFGLI